MLARLLLVVFVATFLGAAACSSKGGQSDVDTPVEEKDGGTSNDGGDKKDEEDEDPRCRSDEACPVNQYCERSSGECTDAKACDDNDDCDYQWPGQSDYCEFGGCFCDTERNNGTCRPRFRLCDRCERDVECGDDDMIYDDYVATCQVLGGLKTCLATFTRAGCPPAYVPNADGTFCEPAGGTCPPKAPCASDSDCDPMSDTPICDVGRGFCVEACEFDFTEGRSDCPPGQVCHVDPRLLASSNPNFGAGKCGEPCGSGSNPTVCAEKTACVMDGDPVMAEQQVNRCRPEPPKCIRNADCPQSPETFSNGYCDRATLDCSTGCMRTSDCFEGYKCVDNQCVEKTCIEKGGATLGCDYGQFCCGEENSVTPCPTGVQIGKCYDAPAPTWCGECSTLGAAPSMTPSGIRKQDSICVKVEGASGLRGASGRGEVKPVSDPQVLFHSCDPETDGKNAACPRWQCRKLGQFCENDSDCGTGECNISIGFAKVCGCGTGDSCPSGSVCVEAEDDQGNPLKYCEARWCDPTERCIEFPEQE